MFEIWGGDLASLSFYDGGPAEFLELAFSIEEARKVVASWHDLNFAAWIQDEEGRVVQ